MVKRYLAYGIAMVTMALPGCGSGGGTNTVQTLRRQADLAQLDTATYTALRWEDTILQIGNIRMGDSVFVQFRFENTGPYDLYLENAHSTCGCAEVRYPHHAISPGSIGELSASFRNKYPAGRLNQSVDVICNTRPRRFHRLVFQGLVVDTTANPSHSKNNE